MDSKFFNNFKGYTSGMGSSMLENGINGKNVFDGTSSVAFSSIGNFAASAVMSPFEVEATEEKNNSDESSNADNKTDRYKYFKSASTEMVGNMTSEALRSAYTRSSFNWSSGLNVDTFSMAMNDSVEKAKNEYRKNKLKKIQNKYQNTDNSSENSNSDKAEDPLGLFETVVGGLYEGSRAISRFNQKISNKIKGKGFSTNNELAQKDFKEFMEDPATSLEDKLSALKDGANMYTGMGLDEFEIMEMTGANSQTLRSDIRKSCEKLEMKLKENFRSDTKAETNAQILQVLHYYHLLVVQ